MKIQSRFSILSLFFVLSFFSTGAFGQESCLSGKAGHDSLVTQLRVAKVKSGVTQSIYKQYKLPDVTQVEATPKCKECSAAPLENPKEIGPLSNHLNGVPAPPTLVFKPECLAISNTFEAGTSEVMCPSGQILKSKNPKTDGLCLTNEIMTYQNAVISSFLNCAKRSGLTTFSASSLFKMFSIESAFKPQYASGGGTGMGQLTGIFVDDIHQKWRGFKFLDKIAKSDLQECEAAKIIAQQDIQSKPKISNRCSFIQTGEGFERNILYSLVGMANSWERDIEPKLKPYLETHKDSPLINEVKELAMINAYGHGGRVAARALISRLSQSKPGEFSTPETFLERAKKPLSFTRKNSKGESKTISLNGYSLGMNARQNDIEMKLPEPIKSNFAKQGAAACINP